jgi:hypothetical protein
MGFSFLEGIQADGKTSELASKHTTVAKQAKGENNL